MTDLTKRRNILADKYGDYSDERMIFLEGWDACQAEMQAELNELKYDNERMNIVSGQDNRYIGELQKELDTFKQALDVSINMHKKIESNPRWAQNNSTKALTSINEILNKTKQGE